jgi:hypothetical protein
MEPKKRRPWLSIISILLVVAASTGLVSAAMSTGQFPGFERFFGGVYWSTPTKTYEGYMNTSYSGTYHYVDAQPTCRNSSPPCLLEADEVVFYITTNNGNVRLIFYCGTRVTYYCSGPNDLPFREGDCIFVKGTLLVPSDWPTERFNPTLQFVGDLYVFKYSNLLTSACS